MSRSVRAVRLVLSDHGVGLFAAEGAQAIVAVRRVSARTACSRCGTDRGNIGAGGNGLGTSPTPLPVERHSRRFGHLSRDAGRAIKICDLTDAASDPKVDVMS